MSEPKRRVLIVTPTFNSEAFLDETIYSVVAQAGRGIDLHYHLQDGGSRDGTVEILKKWARRVAKSELPVLCNTLTLTFSSERDGGMYDALNRGFACLDPQPDDLLTWINSDDRLNLGAVSTVCAAMRDIPECQFVSGRISLINEEGAVTTVKGPGSYPRGTLAAGMHDGRREAFVMQEGTFFSGALWLAVGGVDVGYRLAGDWDLWRRMGQRAELYGIDTVTAVHRRRRGQLSGDMNKYYAEIDALPAEILAVVRPEQQTSNLIRWETYTSRWISLPFNAAASPPPDLISQGRVARGCHCKFHEGFLPPEGPYPEYHLPGGVRWMSRFEARIWITAIMSGRHRVRAKLRSTENGLIFVARINDQEAYRARLPDPLPMKDEVVEFSCWLRAGLNDFHLITESAEQSGRRLMIVELEVTEDAPFTAGASGSVAASETALDHHTAQRLAVVVHLRHRPDLLDATIASVRSEAGPRAHLTVVGESTGASADLLAVVSSWVDEVVEPMKARKNVLIERLPALRAGGFNHVLELEAGDVLAPGGLSCAFDLMARSGALAVRGLEATRNSVGVLVRRGFSARAARASLRAVSSPSRFRRGAVADMARLFVVAAQTGYPAEKRVVLGPRMILLDRRNERTIAHSRLFNLAAALALLGLDVRHVRVEPTDDGREPAALQGCEVVTNGPGAELIDGPLMTLEAGKGGWSSLRPCNPAAAEAELRLPAAIDTAAFKPRSKWDSRIRFGLPPSASILLIDVGDWTMASGLAKDLARACADHGLVLLDAGEETFPSELAPYRCASGASLSDPVVASYQLNAVDFVIQHQGRWSDLILAAAACGLPALDAAGRLVGPDGELELIAPDLIGAVARLFADRDLRAQIALKSRAVVEAEWSLEALAAQLRREAAKLTVAPGLAEWVGGRHELEVGPVPVRSGSASRLDPSTLSDMLGFRFIPIEGAQGLLPEPSRVVAPFAMRITADEVILVIDLTRFPAERLDLQFASDRPETWRLRLNGAEMDVGLPEAGVVDVLLYAHMKVGVNRLFLTRVADGRTVAPPTLTLAGCRVLTSFSQQDTVVFDSGAIVIAPLSGALNDRLYRDGDWYRGEAFFPEEGRRPDLGLHANFCWSRGRECTLMVKVERGGLRTLRLAVTGFLEGQRVRLVVAGLASAWSPPLPGETGRFQLLEWVVLLSDGVAEVVVELSMSSGEELRDLGIIIVDLQLGNLLIDASPIIIQPSPLPAVTKSRRRKRNNSDPLNRSGRRRSMME